ncbi:hypothetical protein CONPUDRAFT_152556 [Coniophora puteana RWD-64-598 SS2]|uniref:Uncharacterized protein n=1 Tax=Coniophora puteana (strain RWD-64-598) TaxID=741705 RepID=A0A5M3MWL4_CONPW|nr:uncharacterized protein CONPUDRAFT_152556 [Coniophora puteana RWD-64-598 SS2]EIW83539.1 hypothetical protein CONPUDRAFT_152556 [Coniophora puteana RWD-64-598 SS2]
MSQDSGMWAVHAILNTDPTQPRNFSLDILKKRPHILDLLLDCAILDRPSEYPEIQVPSTACEILGLIFNWPDYVIPGISPQSEIPTMCKSSEARDLKAIMHATTTLTACRDWSEKLIEVWMHIEEEDMGKIYRNYNDTIIAADLNTISTPGEINFTQLFEFRVNCRVATLRLITTLTHQAQSCSITNAQIESFLHIAYHSCQKPCKLPDQVGGGDEMLYGRGVLRYPTVSNSPTTGTKTGIPFIICSQAILGPIALIRLLVILAQRKAIAGIQALRKAPAGLSSSTSLEHIKQITHPEIIRRVITIAQERILGTIQGGRDHLKQGKEGKEGGDINLTCSFFTSAAELALALIALDTHTDGAYTAEIRGARKQLVIALGNAAQMALKLGQHQRALHFASGAVSAAANIAEDEGLDPSITEKNKRRVDQALAGLQRQP